MSIYTRQGDRGETGLRGGARVRKDDVRIEALGALDELNAFLGWAGAAWPEAPAWLRRVQHCLFDIGAELAAPAGTAPEEQRIGAAEVAELEAAIDELERELEPLRRFILPGGSEPAARLHVARTVCRRAERCVVRLGGTAPVRPEVLQYLNRLSDLLFVAARAANRRCGAEDVPYRSGM